MSKRLLSLLAFIAVVGTSFYVGYSIETFRNDTFLEVFEELRDNHFSQPTDEQLWQGAIDGMIDSLDDPYTSFFPPTESSSLTDQLE